MAGKFIFNQVVSGMTIESLPMGVLTFHGMDLAPPLVQLPVPGQPLSHLLLVPVPLLVLMLVAPAYILVVVEYGGAYRLLGPVLADDVIVNPLLEVARVELRYTKVIGLIEHGPTTSFDGRVIASREARIEFGRSPRGG